MSTLMIVGVTIGGVGLFILFLGSIFAFSSRRALNKPPVHDGIGGKDTENLMNGCLGAILGTFCIYGGFILAAIGGIIALIAGVQ